MIVKKHRKLLSKLKPKLSKMEIILLIIMVSSFAFMVIRSFTYHSIYDNLPLVALLIVILAGLLFVAYHADRESQWKRDNPNESLT